MVKKYKIWLCALYFSRHIIMAKKYKFEYVICIWVAYHYGTVEKYKFWIFVLHSKQLGIPL